MMLVWIFWHCSYAWNKQQMHLTSAAVNWLFSSVVLHNFLKLKQTSLVVKRNNYFDNYIILSWIGQKSTRWFPSVPEKINMCKLLWCCYSFDAVDLSFFIPSHLLLFGLDFSLGNLLIEPDWLPFQLNMQEGMEGNPMAATMKKFSRGIAVLTVPFTCSFQTVNVLHLLNVKIIIILGCLSFSSLCFWSFICDHTCSDGVELLK